MGGGVAEGLIDNEQDGEKGTRKELEMYVNFKGLEKVYRV